jgi:threonyl-tRNA synthetase
MPNVHAYKVVIAPSILTEITTKTPVFQTTYTTEDQAKAALSKAFDALGWEYGIHPEEGVPWFVKSDGTPLARIIPA